jgi:hypothetical protein
MILTRTTSAITSLTIAACIVALFIATFAYAPNRLDAAGDKSQVMFRSGAEAWAQLNCKEQRSIQHVIVRVHADDLLTVAAIFDDIRNRNGLSAACTAALASGPQNQNALFSSSTAENKSSAVVADIARSY